MCDTMGFFHEGSAIFAKNSDRSPNEPQVLEYIPAKDHDETELKVTYTTVPQVPHTKAILISRPVWLWGAEMGAGAGVHGKRSGGRHHGTAAGLRAGRQLRLRP